MPTQTGMTRRKAPYEAIDYTRLVGNTRFSEELMETHLELYEGYVDHTNKNLDMLREGSLDAYAEAELRRRFVWEFNGMRLHEFYFGAMTPGGSTMDEDGPLMDAIRAEFGDFGAWDEDFRQTGKTRGVGWACLSYDPVTGRLQNHWINEHDAGALAGCDPILIMDLFEHAFIRDFGTDRPGYMSAYFDAVDWAAAESRFRHTTECATHADRLHAEAATQR